ncbi:MAG: histidine kinase [Acidobacteriota bacterium]
MGELLNLVGLSTGVVLYAMLLAMVLRAGRAGGGQTRVDPLLVVTSVLGLFWNLCALAVYEFPRVGVDGPFPAVAAVGFSALGFLPAVVVHSVLRGDRDGVRGRSKTALAAVAYSVAAVAAVLHIRAVWTGGAVPAAAGMRLLTYTFILLVLPLAVVTRRQPGSRRAMWGAALAIFAVSALHLSQLHRGEASWPVELVGHHASLPLAFAILYQDYPFALADLFLKRALSLLAIVTLAFGAVGTFGVRSTAFAQFLQQDPRQVGLLVTLCVATALVYPSLRRVTAHFVDRVLLHRPDYPSLRAALARRVQAHDQIATLLPDVCALLAPALSSNIVTWREWRSGGDDEALGGVVLLGEAAAAIARSVTARDAFAAGALPLQSIAAAVVLSTTDLPRYVILVAGLSGGRRILSDDRATLEAISVVVARRIDAIRITDERYEREIRVQEMGKLASQAELRALRAQVNPHFLFNALTTIGYLIQTAPPRALETLMRLTSLLRAVLRSEGEFTTLGRELDMIESYLDIERARFEQRLHIIIDVPIALRSIRLPPLVLQPVVENAVKHGVAPLRAGGEVRVRASIEHTSRGRSLLLVVQDTGAGATEESLRQGREAGVGLRNVERRLAGQYGAQASLTVHSVPGHGTTVEIRLPPDARVTPEPAATAAAS